MTKGDVDRNRVIAVMVVIGAERLALVPAMAHALQELRDQHGIPPETTITAAIDLGLLD